MNVIPNQVKFGTKSSLLISSYAFISLTNFLLITDQIFTRSSSLSVGLKTGLFSAALAIVFINCMVILYFKSRKMPKQGININAPMNFTSSTMPIVFTILQIIMLAILITLYVLCDSEATTGIKIFTISSMVILNIGIILMFWNFSTTYCTRFIMGRPGMGGPGMGGPGMGMNSSYGSSYGQQQTDQYGNMIQ